MKKKSILFLLILAVFFSVCAISNEYDGLWFLGFNLHKDIFNDENGFLVRKAFYKSINFENILAKADIQGPIPYSIIPYSMPGYLAEQKNQLDIKLAKELMVKAGYPIYDQRLKNISLLHTKGIKTKIIVEELKKDLKNIGINLVSQEVSYTEQDKWQEMLKSGQNHLFLMGFKAEKDSLSFLKELFYSNSKINFTFFYDKKFDQMIDKANIQCDEICLEQINKYLVEKLPIIGIFYIKKI